jgi:broad specificity phosphatase PhoE
MECNTIPELFFLRHGETVCNSQGYWYCEGTKSINKNGQRQAEEIKSIIERVNPDRIFCSPMERCIVTAKIVNGDNNHRKIVVIDDLRERNLEGLKNMTTDKIHEKYGLIMDSPTTSKVDNIDNVEKSYTFHLRVKNCMDDIVQKKGDSEIILIVTHGGVLWSLAQQYLKITPKYKTFLNCALLGADYKDGMLLPKFSKNMRDGWYSEINPAWTSLQL